MLAHICGLGPDEVNHLRVHDFLVYLDGIDAYIEANTPKD